MGTEEGMFNGGVQEWHVAVDGAQKGPLTLAEIEDLAKQGKINAASLAWRKGMTDWQPISQIQELGTLAVGTAPPPMPQKQAVNPYLQKYLGEAGAEKASTQLQQIWDPIKRILSSDFGAATQYRRSQQFQNLTKTDAVKHVIQFANLNGYTIQEIKESEGLLILAKSEAMAWKATFPITCMETGDGIIIEVTIKGFITNHFVKKRILSECFEGLKSTILSIQHGIPPTPIIHSGQKQPSGNASFLQGMNQGCGCLVAGALVLFLLWFIGSVIQLN